MRKLLLTALGIFGLAAAVQATVSIEIDAGELRTALGTGYVPQNGLLQLVASTGTGTFGAPTATSFVSGDNVVVASFAMNYLFGTGETDNIVTLTLANTGAASPTKFDAGDALILRWYPTLTLSSTAPGLGTMYGQYRNSSGEEGGIPWVTPTDGTTLRQPNGLNFLTTDITSGPPQGTNPPSAGYANFIVTVVPEPSAVVLVCVAALGLMASRPLRRSVK